MVLPLLPPTRRSIRKRSSPSAPPEPHSTPNLPQRLRECRTSSRSQQWTTRPRQTWRANAPRLRRRSRHRSLPVESRWNAPRLHRRSRHRSLPVGSRLSPPATSSCDRNDPPTDSPLQQQTNYSSRRRNSTGCSPGSPARLIGHPQANCACGQSSRPTGFREQPSGSTRVGSAPPTVSCPPAGRYRTRRRRRP